MPRPTVRRTATYSRDLRSENAYRLQGAVLGLLVGIPVGAALLTGLINLVWGR